MLIKKFLCFAYSTFTFSVNLQSLKTLKERYRLFLPIRLTLFFLLFFFFTSSFSGLQNFKSCVEKTTVLSIAIINLTDVFCLLQCEKGVKSHARTCFQILVQITCSYGSVLWDFSLCGICNGTRLGISAIVCSQLRATFLFCPCVLIKNIYK